LFSVIAGLHLQKPVADMSDVIGHAIYDHYFKLSPGKLWIHNKFGEPDEMPVEVYFRNEFDMPELEWEALRLCKGKTLDIGAGAGSHVLFLQQQNLDATAIEMSPLACSVMARRGVKKIINQNIYDYSGARFDTLLLLMNGIGLTSNIAGLHTFLKHIKTLLNAGGQVLFDSSDVAYLYEKKRRETGRYYGEIDFRYEYKRRKTPWFNWLYVDDKTMKDIAEAEGFAMEVLYEDEHSQYLARLKVVA
jgi:cyclopropane fatty-acyl-phospholipid synthase-like methyltransferase